MSPRNPPQVGQRSGNRATRTDAQAVTLKPQAVRRIAGRYPFGHQKDIADAPEGLEPGAVVTVRGPDGSFVGRGYWNAGGATPLRLLTWQDEQIGLDFYRRRVREALARREGRVTGTNALRVLHAEADGMPGVVADQFGDVLSVQLRNAGVESHRDHILRALREETGATAAFERSDTGERRKEGLDLTSGALWGELPDEVEFFEDDLRLSFRPLEAQKTGFFLDQRDNRRLMRSLVSAGQSFLDVYSYTGSFSLHAAKAGARAVAIDKDQVALATLEGVARRNGVSVGVRWGDALEQLSALQKEKRRFDAAVFDPPTLAKRKDDLPRAKKIFTDGVGQVLDMLNPGGHLLVSTCAHYIGVNDLLDASRVAAGQAGCGAEVVAITYQPADHPHRLSVPESLYLKSLLLRKED
ncbi:class I SAM-dependent rRNA methyltransferase [Deinococcus radiophilus]|uniref:Class I SAM-dependent rRNA methyltransferase n=1 Tax=Deinococcus radiophilus TaxID=32062 RepID=A0A3S0KND1_9DEIO|nr:class I SAM-dependent rRNA methyltransferase [Deinococcus radiophilus]RTR30698.1 class I SAM-dependent rRNA methyltransferase [Deinococcus radiophilus]UFA51250.1 class I SAM-dependent rRNA methyltransferase [Deinococcus radiophilus]